MSEDIIIRTKKDLFEFIENWFDPIGKRLEELEKKVEILEGKVEGLGENIWDMKEKKEWSKIDEIIDEIMEKEDVDEGELIK